MHILLIKTSSMGDVIHTLPALSDAFKAIPNFSCDWVIEEGFAEIPTWHSAVRKVIPVALRRWRQNWQMSWKKREISLFLQQLRTEHYDCIIDAQGLLKSAIVAFLAKGESYGLAFNAARESMASLFYRHKFSIDKNLHAITRIRELFAKSLHYPISPDNFLDYGIKGKFCVPDNHEKSTEKYVVFVHGSSHVDKCWQEEKWIAMAKLVNAVGLDVVLPWGSEVERGRAESIARSSSNITVLPKLSLGEIAELLIEAKGVIAVDTGLGHLSAALAVPTVSLYGPTAPALVGTRGEKVQHVIDFANISAQAVWKVLEGLL